MLFHADIARTPEQTGRQCDDRFDEVENGSGRDTEEPERQQEKPDKGVEDDREQCQGPAQDQQDQPEYKGQHNIPPFTSILLLYPGLSINP